MNAGVPRVQATAVTAPPVDSDQVTPEMIHSRTCQLARLNGRLDGHISQRDYEQAKRELYRERGLGLPEWSFELECP